MNSTNQMNQGSISASLNLSGFNGNINTTNGFSVSFTFSTNSNAAPVGVEAQDATIASDDVLAPAVTSQITSTSGGTSIALTAAPSATSAAPAADAATAAADAAAGQSDAADAATADASANADAEACAISSGAAGAVARGARGLTKTPLAQSVERAIAESSGLPTDETIDSATASQAAAMMDGSTVDAVAAADAASTAGAVEAADDADAVAEASVVEEVQDEDSFGVPLEVVAKVLSAAQVEGADICGMTIGRCSKIWNESKAYWFERGCDRAAMESMTVAERVEYMLDSFDSHANLYEVKALSESINLFEERRSLMRKFKEASRDMCLSCGMSEDEYLDLFSVLKPHEEFTTGEYLLGACDNDIEFRQNLEPFSVERMMSDPEFADMVMTKLKEEDSSAAKSIKRRDTSLHNKINQIFKNMDERSYGRFTLRQKRFCACLALIYMSFAHDLSKIRTDFDIRAANGLKYIPNDSLSQFIHDTKTPVLLVRHLIGRYGQHDKLGMSYGVDFLKQFCRPTYDLLSQFFDLYVESQDQSCPLTYLVIHRGDVWSSRDSFQPWSSNIELLKIMATELPAMRLRMSQINSMLATETAYYENKIRNQLFFSIFATDPAAAAAAGIDLGDLSTTTAANGRAAAATATATATATAAAAAAAAAAADAAAEGDEADEEYEDDGVVADAKEALKYCQGEGVDDDALPEKQAPRNVSMWSEIENRRTIWSVRFSTMDRHDFANKLCIWRVVMEAASMGEYERAISSVNEVYSDIYLSDNCVFFTKLSRASASLLFGANRVNYNDLETNLQWNGMILQDMLRRNGLYANGTLGYSYNMTECNGTAVIFNGFGVRVSEEKIFEQGKVKIFNYLDDLMNDLARTIALYAAARREQRDYLLEHRKILLRAFEVITSTVQTQRLYMLRRMDEVSRGRWLVLEHFLNVFESLALIHEQDVLKYLSPLDPIATALKDSPKSLLKQLQSYPVDTLAQRKQAAIEATMAAANAVFDKDEAISAAPVSLAVSAAADAASADTASADAASADAADAAAEAGADGDVEGMATVEAGEMSSVKDMWMAVAQEYESRCEAIDFAACAAALHNLKIKGKLEASQAEVVVMREFLGAAVALLIATGHADDDLEHASRRSIIRGGFDYHKMKIRGISVSKLIDALDENFDPLKLPEMKKLGLTPARFVFKDVPTKDLLNSAEHANTHVTVCFENGIQAMRETFGKRAVHLDKLREQLKQSGEAS